ncbi:MAG: DeoR/GlpR transcriptional regulator [Proteobacteria bacterium]|nr:DeoR/GlpR transcriptional regulator [Pseudomonadota bacterium]
MGAEERHRRILALLHRLKRVTAESIAEELEVSRETVRRDLVKLEQDGAPRRVHGGGVLPEPQEEAPFEKRMTAQAREKQVMARAIHDLLRPDMTCFVGAGTTTAVLATELCKAIRLTVITNSISVASTVRSGSSHEVILLGDALNGDVPGTYGELTLSEIGRFHTDLTIISPIAVDEVAGVTTFAFQEAEVARAMIAQGRKLVVLAGHTKLGTTSGVYICNCPKVDVLVTDAGADRSALRSLTRGGVVKTIVHLLSRCPRPCSKPRSATNATASTTSPSCSQRRARIAVAMSSPGWRRTPRRSGSRRRSPSPTSPCATF